MPDVFFPTMGLVIASLVYNDQRGGIAYSIVGI